MSIKKKINKFIFEYLDETTKTSSDVLYNTLINLKKDLAIAAQKIYDKWEQDNDGYDEYYGSGGICDDIADAMCNVIYRKTNYDCTTLYNEYDCHTSIYVYDSENKILYNVDIPPYVYEKGFGYTWKKIKDVKFHSDYISIVELDYDDFFNESGEMINESIKNNNISINFLNI
jgi:hypothetical protein